MTLVYAAIVLPLFAAFGSMAVDFGRVEVAKSQLESTADAAARAAVSQLSPGSNASADFTDGTTQANVILTASALDAATAVKATTAIAFGTWASGVFSSGNVSSSNAVRVTMSFAVPTMWAAVLGSKTCTVDTSAIAMISPPAKQWGVVGLGGMMLNTAVVVDSYSPLLGTYAATHAQNAGVASAGGWNIGTGFTVKGNLYYSSTGAAPSGGTVTGSRLPLSSSPSLASLYPAVTAPVGATQGGNYNGGNLTLTAGNYYYTNFTINPADTLTVTGVVNIYVNGNVNLNGNVNVGGLPSSCNIYNLSSSGINVGGSGSIYAELYGPSGPVNFNTSGDLYGSLVGSQISTGGTGRIHVDTSYASSGGAIMLVK